VTIMRCGRCLNPDIVITGTEEGWILQCGGPDPHVYPPTPGAQYLIMAAPDQEFRSIFPEEDP